MYFEAKVTVLQVHGIGYVWKTPFCKSDHISVKFIPVPRELVLYVK